MGGCHCSGAKEPCGLVLPEQEIAISDQEALHPFGRALFSTCFQTFIQLPEQLPECEFFAILRSLELDAGLFTDKTSRFTLYHYELKRATGQINVKQLLLSFILLSNTTWQEKLVALCKVWALNPQSLQRTELHSALEALATVAAQIHPAMAAVGPAVGTVRYYSSRITRLKAPMLSTVLALLCPRPSTTLLALTQAFETHSGLQKLFWGSGMRLLLLEEEIKLQGSSYQTSPRLRNRSPNKNWDNGVGSEMISLAQTRKHQSTS